MNKKEIKVTEIIEKLTKKKGLKLNSIRTKLMVGMITVCIVPLLMLGLGSYNQAKSILNENIKLTSEQTLTEVNNSLSEYFNGLEDIVSMTTSNEHFINIDTDNNVSYVQDLLNSLKDNKQDLLFAYYGTPSGTFIISPDTKMSEGFDATTRDWYQLAVKNQGEIVITSPYVDAVTGDNVITVAKTVEKDGQVVGVMAVDCTLAALTEKMNENQVGTSGYVFIASEDGTILTHPQADVINTKKAAELDFWDEAQTEDSGFAEYELSGVKKFAVFQTNEDTGWKIIAALEKSELTTDTKSILETSIIIIVVMFMISLVFSFLLSNGLAKNIHKLKEVFGKASNGDLTVSITAATKDEFSDLANSFNIMMSNISELTRSVTTSSETVLQTSTNLANMSSEVTLSISEVAKAIEEVSNGATNQAQDAQNGVSEMEKLSSKLDTISNHSFEMDEISNSTKSLGSKGLSMVDTLIEKSNKTKLSAEEVNSVVEDMYESSKQISAISDTLSSITSQTNLLSLNASIESARAGEAGKGFAVVAGEIRKLAEESKISTEEIKQIIAGIQSKTKIAAEAIKSTKDVVNEQEIAVSQTKEIFSEILASIETMIAKVEEIRISITDTNESKSSLVLSIDSISGVSQETASATEEVTASTEEITATMEEFSRYSNDLQGLANQLKDKINKFKVK
ncbi:MAG: methyl-accepting chemotaxis protein [Lachnotalea sp.]